MSPLTTLPSASLTVRVSFLAPLAEELSWSTVPSALVAMPFALKALCAMPAVVYGSVTDVVAAFL